MAQSSNITPPDIRATISPVLLALPGAAVSTEPPTSVLPALSPILRQRAQLLSSASTEPWIRLLTYEPAQVPKLTGLARNGSLDPHPVSGEVELDWDCEVAVNYKRIDQETLQAMVVPKEIGLFFRLVWCVGDPDGGDGWRVGEVGVSDSTTATSFGGHASISEAETAFQTAKPTSSKPSITNGNHAAATWRAEVTAAGDDEDDDDDDYWARYDATPSRTPAANGTPALRRSPGPSALARTTTLGAQAAAASEAEDAYFAQYDSVQPAMDNHDPDEEASLRAQGEPLEPLQPVNPASLRPSASNGAPLAAAGAGREAPKLAQPVPVKPVSPPLSGSRGSQDESWVLAHPRPASSAGSAASQTVAKLEEVAETRQQTEFGVRQHVARSIRSLFLLSRASGIDRDEFERMVRTELDVLGMVENDM